MWGQSGDHNTTSGPEQCDESSSGRVAAPPSPLPLHSVISGGHDANDAATGSGRVALPLPPSFNFSLLIILFVTTATATEKL